MNITFLNLYNFSLICFYNKDKTYNDVAKVVTEL